MSVEIKNKLELEKGNEVDLKSKKARNKKKIKIILISFAAFFVFYHVVIMPIATMVIYEAIFGGRYEVKAWETLSVDDFDGLVAERSDFDSDGTPLAGYKYSKQGQEVRGVVVLVHGFACGGHKLYMTFADYFTSNGYLVFSYDGSGNGESGGDSTEGLPRGIVDLNNALDHVKSLDEYKGLPILLFGHSMGGYSVGNVLGKHPDVTAAAIVAGFNESEDMLISKSLPYAGVFTYLSLPYLELYEFLKFGGEYVNITAIEEMGKTDAGVMILHSKDDETVPMQYGYDKFYAEYSDDERFEFRVFENKGHNFIYYSDAAIAYREQLETDYQTYLAENGKKDSAKVKEAYMIAHVDKKQYFEPDHTVMGQIIDFFDEYCQK